METLHQRNRLPQCSRLLTGQPFLTWTRVVIDTMNTATVLMLSSPDEGRSI